MASTTSNYVPHGKRIHPLRVRRTTMCGIHTKEPGARVRHPRRTTPPFPFPTTTPMEGAGFFVLGGNSERGYADFLEFHIWVVGE
jgi:hypothetical protein